MSEWLVSYPHRLDSFLAEEGRVLSREKAKRAIEEGHVRVNDVIVKKPAHRLEPGDRVIVSDDASTPTESAIEPKDLHLEILYEDEQCFVINKPAGYSVHPGAGAIDEPTILHGVALLFTKMKIPFSSESVLVHRLDKDTTGCLLIAKNPAAHIALQKQFETRTVKKTYLALVAGIPEKSQAKIDAPIGRSSMNPTKMAITGTSTSREAQTTYRIVGKASNVALLECDLHTGRTHQIRVHLAGIGHPVLGDSSYSSSLSERLAQELEINSLCLHSWKLTFASPADEKEHSVKADPAAQFLEILKRLEMNILA